LFNKPASEHLAELKESGTKNRECAHIFLYSL
jgi:hypothetical protein